MGKRSGSFNDRSLHYLHYGFSIKGEQYFSYRGYYYSLLWAIVRLEFSDQLWEAMGFGKNVERQIYIPESYIIHFIDEFVLLPTVDVKEIKF